MTKPTFPTPSLADWPGVRKQTGRAGGPDSRHSIAAASPKLAAWHELNSCIAMCGVDLTPATRVIMEGPTAHAVVIHGLGKHWY